MTIDGQDIRDVTQTSLRSVIGTVMRTRPPGLDSTRTEPTVARNGHAFRRLSTSDIGKRRQRCALSRSRRRS